MPCEHCGRDLEAKRRGARFCSDRCRKAAWTASKARALQAIREDLAQAAVSLEEARRKLAAVV